MSWNIVRNHPSDLFAPIPNLGSSTRGREHAVNLGLSPGEIIYYDLSELILTPDEKTFFCGLIVDNTDGLGEKLSVRKMIER
jgi:hypothetical protein